MSRGICTLLLSINLLKTTNCSAFTIVSNNNKRAVQLKISSPWKAKHVCANENTCTRHVQTSNMQKSKSYRNTSYMTNNLSSALFLLPQVMSFGTVYSNLLQRAPVVTKSVTASIIFALSDILAQTIQKKDTTKENKIIELRRLIATGIFGLLYFGPAAHYWYEWMYTAIPLSSPSSTAKKTMLGQLIFGPVSDCMYFVSTLIQTKTFTLSTWMHKIRTDLPSVVLAGGAYWPLMEIIGYTYVPKAFMPLFIHLSNLLWTTFLALKSYAKENK
jgi:protein Mpv17